MGLRPSLALRSSLNILSPHLAHITVDIWSVFLCMIIVNRQNYRLFDRSLEFSQLIHSHSHLEHLFVQIWCQHQPPESDTIVLDHPIFFQVERSYRNALLLKWIRQ